ncbi:hypothetical protein KUTeg_001598 [Tegillarca granosa]|uniref:Uncharacterized protein n=1 Tax=Tegillarca granosa TaxID=220873 RepID=A0ABQ9FTE0_TEGGR|nr:hypothetical protein KUTeg_001598 [Tegillarca granosa]
MLSVLSYSLLLITYVTMYTYGLKNCDDNIRKKYDYVIGFYGHCGEVTITEPDVKDTQLYKLLKTSTKQMGMDVVDCNNPDPIGLCIRQTNIKDGRRHSNSQAFLRNVDRPNLHIVTGAYVEKIRRVADLPVGENIQDHFGLNLDILLDIPTMSLYNLSQENELLEYFFNRKGNYANVGTNLNLFLETERQNKFNWPDIQVFINDGLLRNGILDASKDSIMKTQEGNSAIQDGITLTVILLHPSSRGNIKLRNKKPNLNPAIDLKLLSSKDDVKHLIKGIRKIQDFVNTPALKAVNARIDASFENCLSVDKDTDEYWSCVIRNYGSPYIHSGGSCRMGMNGDPNSVVDAWLR